MSFGFSVGDFIAVGELAVKIADTLRGTRAEYQELVRELEKYAVPLRISVPQVGITQYQKIGLTFPQPAKSTSPSGQAEGPRKSEHRC